MTEFLCEVQRGCKPDLENRKTLRHQNSKFYNPKLLNFYSLSSNPPPYRKLSKLPQTPKALRSRPALFVNL